MTLKLIGKGMAKSVYACTTDPTVAYYMPKWSWNKAELKKEVATASAIQQALKQLNRSDAHLAIQLETTTPIKGKYTVKTPRAHSDLETEIRKTNLTFLTRLSLCQQFLEGMSALHATGYLHKDLKPTNALIYYTKEENGSSTQLKISDWGLSENTGTNTAINYNGNGRFSPPERLASCASETYSCGLILVRILEEALLKGEKTLLLTPPKSLMECSQRGIIKYMIMHPQIKQPRVSTPLESLKRIRALWNKNKPYNPTSEKRRKQELIHHYINALSLKLQTEGLCSKQIAIKLSELIKAMTLFDPSQRPSTQRAYTLLTEIIHLYQQENLPPKPPSIFRTIGSNIFNLIHKKIY